MKKLKNKVFITISLILTLVVIAFCVSNITTLYSNQKHRIISTFEQMKNINKKDDKIQEIDSDDKKPLTDNKSFTNEFYDKVFIDLNVYTIILDDEDNLKEVINHDINSTDNTNIENIAKEILKKEKEEYIGNLFISKYSYTYNNNNLIIIDNLNIKETLINGSIKILIIFILSEIFILIISYYLTKWITNPVKENFEKQKRFIADSSHELKTPLTVIEANLEAYFNDKDEKWIRNIQEETEQMTKLVVDLLDLATIESKKTYEMRQIDLSNIIESTILTFESLFYEKKIILKYRIDDNIKMIANDSLIKQLIGILIDNAIKHTKSNNKVKIELLKKDNQIYLTVSNEGDPIKKGDEDKIFERFYRADESRNRNVKRYGLGLAIAKEIVLLHKGKITAESSKGYTNFKIIFNEK